MMEVWRIEMLGGLRVSLGDRRINRFPTQLTGALLAYLALFPRYPHPREVMSERFWPDADPDSQRHSLRLALSRLRSLMGPEHPLQTNRLTVSLDRARFVTDVGEFEGAVARGDRRAALRIYEGPLLPGYYLDWVIEEQHRLEMLLEGLADKGPSAPDRLPRGMSRLFGRAREREAVASLLQAGRIVTLTGPGGIGKTRLAEAVAREQRRSVWVHLSDLSDPGQVPDAVRSALNLPFPSPGYAVEDMVVKEMGDVAPILVVLDNLEHMVGSRSMTDFLSRIASANGVSVLATSRVSLGLDIESVFPVGPLQIAEGAELFRYQAQRVQPDFMASDEDLLILSERLGAMPLALELAAARTGVQPLAEIGAVQWATDGDFGGSIGIPVRQRSLDQVLNQSLDHQPAGVRAAFNRLGVFRGGFDAVGAKAVANAELGMLETLRRLALITPNEQPDGTLRFRMSEPLRDIAQRGMTDAPRAHARYYADWIEANRADDLPSPPFRFGQRHELQDRERDNILAALEYCRSSATPFDFEIGLRIVAAFWTHWYVRNESAEMERWARTFLGGADEGAKPRRASAELSLALALRERGARKESLARVREAIAVLQRGPQDRNLAFAWHLLGLALSDFARWDEADEAYRKAESVWIEIGDLRNYSITRHNRGMLAAERGHLNEAVAWVGEAMEIFQTHQSTYLAIGYSTMGRIHRANGDLEVAGMALREAANLHGQLGYVRGLAQNERDLGVCLHLLGESDEARALVHRALASFRRVGDRHGEATALAVLSRITGLNSYALEARAVIARHGLAEAEDFF